MRRRTSLTAVAATAIATAALLSNAATASAAPACTAKADLPDRIAVAHDYQTVTAKLIVDCPGLGHAYMDLYGPAGGETEFTYDRPTWQGTWDIYGKQIVTGTYVTRDGQAADADYNQWGTVTPDTSVVKYAGYDAMSVTRTGSTSKFTATASHYDGNPNSALGRSVSKGVTVTFQLYTGSAWINKQTTTTDSTGHATLTVVDPNARTYRTVIADSGTTFGVTSGSVHS